MGEVVDLQRYREKTLERRAFYTWRKRFGETFTCNTHLGDISGKTLFWLAGPGEKSAIAYYELIFGALSLGKSNDLRFIDKDQQLRVIDLHLFLADQVRFEMMRRIGWISSYPCQAYPLIDLVMKFESVKKNSRGLYPHLSETHPRYDAFQSTSDLDKETFIRTLLPLALEEFKAMVD